MNEIEILNIIAGNPGVTYFDIVCTSLYSPTTVWKTLVRLRKENEVESFSIKGKKAVGWRETHDHSIVV